ncbi:MAG: hypothetical protein AAFV95_04865 [Bacteroidota bacterium]
MKLLYSLIIIGFSVISLHAQETIDVDFVRASQELEEVSFEEEDSSYDIIIASDQTDFYFPPQWKKDTRKPVAYVSGRRPKITAKFKNCEATFWVKGMRDGILYLPPLEVILNGSTAIYGPAIANQAFEPSKVQYFQNFDIEWKICNTNSSNEEDWELIETSYNNLYVTHDIPASEQGLFGPTSVYHTSLHLGCVNANGLSGESEIVSNMYTPFLEFDVRRTSDNLLLTYYSNRATVTRCNTLQLLLESVDGDGRCGAFAMLFDDMIKVQGISGSRCRGMTVAGPVGINGFVALSSAALDKIRVNAETFFGINDVMIDYELYHFLVKEWDNTTEGTFIPLSGDSYESAKSDPGALGVRGQGNVDDPRSIFLNHAIVTYDNELFDPSYGKKYNHQDLALYEDEAITVVSGTIIHRVINGEMNYFFWVDKENTINLKELQFYD